MSKDYFYADGFYSNEYRTVMNKSEIQIGEECIQRQKKGDVTFPSLSEISSKVEDIAKGLSADLSSEQIEAIVKYIMDMLRSSIYVLDPTQPIEKLGAAEILTRQINKHLDQVNEDNRKISPSMAGGVWEHVSPSMNDATTYYPLYHEYREEAEMESDYSQVLDDLMASLIKTLNEKVTGAGESNELLEFGATHDLVKAFENLKETALVIVSSYY